MESLWQDVRFGLRMLLKHRGFTAVAVSSLALGIGLNSTVFSLINQTRIEDLPVREPQQVFTLTGLTGSAGERSSFALADRGDFLDQCPSVADVLAMKDESVVAQYGRLPHSLHAQIVSRNYFSFFGLTPTRGRFFTESDDRALQAEPAVVISYNLWQRDFGRDPGVVGRIIQLDNLRVTVFGVAPKGFGGVNHWAPADLWIPAQVYQAHQPRMLARRDIADFSILVRLRPGATVASAQSEAQVVTRRLAQAYPSIMRARDVRLSPLIRRKDARFYLVVVANMLLPGAVLALACANVCALLMARAQSRTREIAARLALGCSRGRLARQMLVESLLLSLMGGAVGLVLAGWAIGALPSLLPPAPFTILPDLHVDGRMLVFTAVLSVLATFLFGLWPAWQATKPALAPLLKSDDVTDVVGRRFTGLRRIVIGQFVISLVLLCIASLFLRSMLQALRNDPGLRHSDLLVVKLNPREYGLELHRIPHYLRQVRERLETMAGVRQVSVTAAAPLGYDSGWMRNVFIRRSESPDRMQKATVRCCSTDEHLFDLMGWRLLSGRGFTPSDEKSRTSVAIVSQAAAQAFWPDRNPVGQVIHVTEANGEACQVIGVVADGLYNLQDGKHHPYFFFPINWVGRYGTFSVLVAPRGSPHALFTPVREALRSVDDRVLPVSIETLHDRIRTSYGMFGRQFLARFFLCFGVLGLLLASIGLYAVVAYAVSRRTQEIGIRMAIGATRASILKLVLRDGLHMALIGVGVGLPVAFGIAQLLRNGLYGFPPADPVTFVAVPVLLLVVALLACWLPARRAAKVEPMVALRCE